MAPAPAPTPKPGAAGKPGGLPIWAWGAAAALGLVLGLVFFKKGSAATAADDSSAASAPTEAADESAGGGVVALSPDLLAALGLRTGSSSEAGSSAQAGSAQAGAGGEAASAQTSFAAPAQPVVSESFDSLRAQGTNQQLPAALQVPGLAADDPVISSYFAQPQTISSDGAGLVQGPNNVPKISVVKQPDAPTLTGAGVGGRSYQAA